MKTIKIFLVILLVLVVFKAWGAETPPKALKDEASDVEHIYKGRCSYNGTESNCILGYQLRTDTMWMFLYTEKGQIYKIVTTKDNVETVKWVRKSDTI